MLKKLIPQSPVRSVRADTSISECIRILRDRSVGALVVLSDTNSQEILGIFTERDLVKNIELLRQGDFWRNPVRVVMTTNVRTITIDEINQAPKLMARYNIRHVPVVSKEQGKTRLIGVISMRDIFRITMEAMDYDLHRAFQSEDTPKKSSDQKLVGVFSKDPAILEVVDQGAKLTKHLVVNATPIKDSWKSLNEYFSRFDILFVDIDGLSKIQIAKILAEARRARKNTLYLAFNQIQLDGETRENLANLAKQKAVALFSKPIALGLLYERFLKAI